MLYALASVHTARTYDFVVLFYICYSIALPLMNLPDTVKSLRKSNNDLKRQLEDAKRDFKKLKDRFQSS